MVDRIRQLLQARQLTPTQFADTIGVARPIVSHILGGRNKPSLEVVQKIIAAFPDIAMPWLLTGQGPMLTAEGKEPASTLAEPHNSPVAATNAPAPSRRPAKASKAAGEAPMEPTVVEPTQRVTPAVPTTVPVAPPAAIGPPTAVNPEDTASTVASALLSPTGKPAKTIRRVLIFYSDGTFTDFSPASEAI